MFKVLAARMRLLHEGIQPTDDTRAGNTFIDPCASLQNPSRALMTATINNLRHAVKDPESL